LSALASTAETCFPDRVNRILIPILSLLWFPAVSAEEGKPAPSPVAVSDLVPGKRATVRFTESPPQSADPLQVRYRLMAAEEPPAYDVSKETFEVLLPAGWDGKSPLGLFLWIDAGDQPRLSEPWEKILAKHQLVYAAARRSGNPRNIFDRLRLAIDANHNLRQQLPIDGRRVYVSGFSGGSRVASMLGVAWGEMFSGTICCMGVNFYTDVAAPDGKVYGLSYLPDEELLPLVKKHCRFALVTGEKDFNRPNTLGAFENGFRKEGFEHVRVFDIPEHGHSLPPPEWLDQAISFVDEGKREAKPAR
jgi:predicted esterase